MENATTIGRYWFQYRSFSPLPLFFLILVLPPEVRTITNVAVWCVAGVALAELIRLWAVGHAGSATRTRGDHVPSLVHAGPYRYVRNPLYIANLILYTTVGVLFGFRILAFFIFLYSAIQYYFIVMYEESLLKESFGQEYAYYQKAVPRWLPLLRPLYPSSGHPFSWKQAFRSERSTLIAIASMGVLFVLKSLAYSYFI